MRVYEPTPNVFIIDPQFPDQAKLKYPEFILGIDAKVVNDFERRTGGKYKLTQGFNEVPYDVLIQGLNDGITIRQRQVLDEQFNYNESFKGLRDVRQWLNYFAVESSGQLLGYLRTRKDGESDLLRRGSIAFGGHLDFVDVVHRNSIINLRLSAEQNIFREADEELVFTDKFGEEVDITHAGKLEYKGVIIDNSDNVGRLHIGICYVLRLKDGYTAAPREEGLEALPWTNIEHIEGYENVTFENWSKIFLSVLKKGL